MFKIANNKSIYLTRGDTAIINLSLKIGYKTYEVAKNDKCVLTVKKSTKSPDALLTKELSNGQFIIKPEDTSTMDYGTYKYDVQLTTADGIVNTVVTPNDFVIEEEVTW